MGLFSKTVTTYAAQTLSLIEDNPKFIPTTIQQAILTGSSISDSLHNALTNNIGVKAKRYYTYGRDFYYYGLPSGTFAGYAVDLNALSNVLNTLVGQPVYIDKANMSSEPDGFYFIQDWLTAHNYNNTTRQFTYHTRVYTYISAEITADNTVVINCTFGSVDSYGNPITVDTTITVTATVAYDDMYITATYHLINSETGLPTGDPQYFIYLVSDGTYPALTPTNTTAQEAPYYPIIPIRYNNVSLTNMDAYVTAKRLGKKIGINIDDIIKGVEANQDIGSIDYAYIVLGFDITTTSEYAINYMVEFYKFLNSNSVYTEIDYVTWLAAFNAKETTNPPPVNYLEIADTKYKCRMYYNYITTKVVEGVIGEIDTVEKEIVILPKRYFYYGSHQTYFSSFHVEQSRLILRRQLTDSAYEEIIVTGLYHINYVAGKGRIETNLDTAVNDPDKNNFLVPLNSYIYDTVLSMKDRIDLMYDCIHIVINCVEVTKLKWYQTGFFQFITLVITIGVTIFAPPVGAGLAAATTATDVAIAIATQIAMTVVVMVVLKVAVKVLGLNATLAVAIAVVAAAYGMQFTQLNNLPWAADFLQIAAALPSAFNQVMSGLGKDLQEQMADFQEMADTKIKEVQELLKNMDYGSNLDPLKLFAGMDYYPTKESVSDYYYRKCHIGNPGVLSLDVISDYVTNTLTLTA